MRKDIRKKGVKRRKNFFPALIIVLFSWGLIVTMICFVNPSTFGAVPAFFLILFVALLFTFSTIFANTRRGILAASGLTLFLILRYLGVGNIINLLLIAGLGITADIYFSRNS
ncbi:MAG: hypothetical protein WBD86_02485 [Microgenomates group bacterium]